MLLISTPLQIFHLDPETQKIRILRTGDGYYYGISAKNGRMVLTHSGGYLQYFGENKSIRTIDHLIQPHQVEWIDDLVLVTNTGKNCVSVFDAKGNFIRDIYLNNIRSDDKNKGRLGNHFNSVHKVENRVFIVAHNYERSSEIWELTWPELEVIGSKYNGGAWAHNIWSGERGLVICDSKNGSLLDLISGKTIWRSGEDNQISRGLAVSDQYIFVGSSTWDKRKNRYWKTGGIWIIDRASLKTIDKIVLPGSGDIHEIRLVGLPDDCHNSQIISLNDLALIKQNSLIINWAYHIRKKYPLFRQDFFPISQLVRAFQLTNRGKRHFEHVRMQKK